MKRTWSLHILRLKLVTQVFPAFTMAPKWQIGTMCCALLCIMGADGFKMGTVRMQTKDTRYCNPNILGPDNNPVKCYISKAEETEGLTYPGMDDGKSLTTRQDTFITKDGQVSVKASPARPYEYILTSETANRTSMLQLFNQTSYPIVDISPQGYDFLQDLSQGLTLEDLGWTCYGIVEVDGDKLHKRTIYGINGTDPKTGMNFTALAMTGLIPNLWALYTDEADKRIVKLQAMNTFQNNMVYQEVEVTHWEELHENITTSGALELVYSAYAIEEHRSTVPPSSEAPRPEAIFIGTELTGELTRLFFNDDKKPEWMPRGQLRGSNGSAAPIEYFKIIEGTASHKFFMSKYDYLLSEPKKLELPPNCMSGGITLNSSYCLYVGYDSNDTFLALQVGMKFIDVVQKLYEVRLNISIFYSSEEKVLDFEFHSGGCAVVFQEGVSFGNVNIKLCLAGGGGGKSLIQPDNVTYRGQANLSVAIALQLPAGNFSVTLYTGFTCQAAPNNNITASATVGIEDRRLVVGANIWVDIFGRTLEHKANMWEFESFFNLKIWAGIWIFRTEWQWTWALFKVGPVRF